jgi:UDP-glucose 4-epimerase
MTADALLVTGGAGYIGSHAVLALRAAGWPVIVLDNLSTGRRAAIPAGVELVEGDVGERAGLARLFERQRIAAVLHFAGSVIVPESVRDPLAYYHNNTVNSLALFDACVRAGIGAVVFSSTAAVYGNPDSVPVPESAPTRPLNPYGRSKLICEWMAQDHDRAFGLRHVALRYFNAAGSSEDGKIGEDHDPETHLIPRVLLAITGEIPAVTILGTDWNTPDGTCIRDYIHVEDLAEAHVLAIEHLAGGAGSAAWNLGTGSGHSVREVLAAAEKVTGKKAPAVEGPRRPGDPSILVAAADRVKRELGWKPQRSALEDIVASAWRWVRAGGRYARRA